MPITLHSQDECEWLNLTPIENFAYPYSVYLIATKMPNDSAALTLF